MCWDPRELGYVDAVTLTGGLRGPALRGWGGRVLRPTALGQDSGSATRGPAQSVRSKEIKDDDRQAELPPPVWRSGHLRIAAGLLCRNQEQGWCNSVFGSAVLPSNGFSTLQGNQPPITPLPTFSINQMEKVLRSALSQITWTVALNVLLGVEFQSFERQRNNDGQTDSLCQRAVEENIGHMLRKLLPISCGMHPGSERY
ncbi:hypothetical protein GH733_012937 [Mirounga leonina]|nr:hypothetical protein GH733_012937 [Mirounga leonina]